MKKRKESSAFAVILIILIIVFLLGGTAVLALDYLLGAPLIDAETDFGISLGCFGVSLVLVIFLGLGLISKKRARRREREAFVSEIEASVKGDKEFIDESSPIYGDAAKAINRSKLLKGPSHYTYGIYSEDKFDDIVLKTLEGEVLASAGLVYFVLVGEYPIREEGPKEALLTMIQSHFGERAYFGKLHSGIAVFVPTLSSREEFLARVKRTVQLFSYTIYGEEENHVNVKGGVAFYPDFAPRLLTAEALKATLEQLSLSVKSNEESAPHLGFDSAEAEAFLLLKKRLLDGLEKAKSAYEAEKLYQEFATKALPYLSADSLGLIVYNQATDDFTLQFEASRKDNASFSLIAGEGGNLSSEVIMPFYEWSRKEKGIVGINETVFADRKLVDTLDAMRVNSVSFLGVAIEDRPIALLFVAAKEKNRFAESRIVLEFLNVSETYAIFRNTLLKNVVNNSREEILLSSFGHYAYAVAQGTYNLSYVSTNLVKAIPQAKVGSVCYQALFGRKKPCKNCPLVENNVEKMIPRIASGVFAYKPVQGEGETMLVLAPHKADFSPSRIDPITGLLSDKSLHEDIQNEILLKDSVGTVLAFRIRNFDAIKSLTRVKDPEEIVRFVSDRLSSSGLGRDLYRNGPSGFAYLLPFASKDDGRGLAEKVCRLFVGKLTFEGKEVEFIFDYALISYPLEAETPFAYDAILRILYQKADAASRGRLFTVDNDKSTLVDVDYYLKTKLEEGLRAAKLPVDYVPYEELSGKNLAFLEAGLMVLAEDGKPIDPKLVKDTADSLEQGCKVAWAMAANIAKFLGNNRSTLSSSTLHGVILPIDSDCLTPVFLDRIETILTTNKAAKSNLYLEVRAEDLGNKNFDAFINSANKRKIRVGLADYNGELPLETLKKFVYVSFSSEEVYGEGKRDLLLSLENVRKAGLSIIVKGYRDNEEKRYLGSLSLHYGKKQDAPRYKEEELVFSA